MNNKIFSILAIFCVCGLLMSSVNAFTGPQTIIYYPFANEIIGDHYRYSGDVVDIDGTNFEKFYTGQGKDISNQYYDRNGYGSLLFCDGTYDSLEWTCLNINLGTMMDIAHVNIWIWDRGSVRCPHINGSITFRDNTTRTFNGGNGDDAWIE